MVPKGKIQKRFTKSHFSSPVETYTYITLTIMATLTINKKEIFTWKKETLIFSNTDSIAQKFQL